jgi:glycyl-tRNA synthetase
LLGLFAVGLGPKGSNDPFALRRAALGIIENLIANGVSCDVRLLLDDAVALLPVTSNAETRPAVLQFITGRLEGVLRERGYPAAVIKAVLSEQSHNPYAASQAIAALSEALAADDWLKVLEAYARCVRITRALPQPLVLYPAALDLPAEKTLLAAYTTAQRTLDGTVPALVQALRSLVPAITVFFIEVLVMDEDVARRDNRLALLQHIANLPRGIADLSHLEGF